VRKTQSVQGEGRNRAARKRGVFGAENETELPGLRFGSRNGGGVKF
jgi:hypothetical protein